jgi:capsular exopolysaccharide synthesis family protein
LRTNIQFASVDKPIHTIMFTSSGPAEGKSTTAANTAVVSAQAGKKTLLVDADLRKPTVHHTFRLNNAIGLTNILAGQTTLEEAIQSSEVEGLDILTSGPIPPNPAELMGSKMMSQLIEEMRKSYELVIFDTPPVIAVTDAQVLATQVEGVILVVNAGKTNREFAAKAKNQLDNVKANILGVVLNNKKIDGDSYYYYYYGNSKN